MQYLPAYQVVNNGKTLVFAGNYDSLSDLIADEEFKNYYYCWREGNELRVKLMNQDELDDSRNP